MHTTQAGEPPALQNHEEPTLDLYLILFAIAALGIFALALIFGGQFKPKKREEIFNADEEELQRTDINQEIISDEAATERQEPVISDPGLSALGFSAIDTVLSEPQDPPLDLDADPQEQIIPLRIPEKRKSNPQQFLVLFLIAPPRRPFAGYELLQALQSAGLEFGEMNIFHRYSENENAVLFSVASAVEPGIFDLANIGGFFCPGLSLFMPLENNIDMSEAFELMLETAEQLAEDLDANICDSDHVPLTTEKLAEYRDKIHYQYDHEPI